jgi:hypothetical protein
MCCSWSHRAAAGAKPVSNAAGRASSHTSTGRSACIAHKRSRGVQAAEAEREALVQQVAAAKDLAPRLSTAEAQLAAAEASLAKVVRRSRADCLTRIPFPTLYLLWSLACVRQGNRAGPVLDSARSIVYNVHAWLPDAWQCSSWAAVGEMADAQRRRGSVRQTVHARTRAACMHCFLARLSVLEDFIWIGRFGGPLVRRLGRQQRRFRAARGGG